MSNRLDEIKVKKSKAYYRETKGYYKILLEKLGNVEVSTIRKSDIQNLLLETSKKLKEKGKDNYSVNAMIRAYKALFNFAIDTLEVEMINPCRKIKDYPLNLKLKYIPPTEDIEKVKVICDSNQELLLNFLDETGARINEALSITGSDVFDEYIILYTRKSKNSNLVPRKLPLPKCFKHMRFQHDKRIFHWWTGQPKFLARKIRILKQKPWGFHSLRHRRASIWNHEKETVFDIMVKLGHSSVKTTQIYLQKLG